MKFKKLELDFSMINTADDLHEKMSELFGFPDFCGKNINALIDCLTSLRLPDDGMTTIHVSHDEAILLKINNMRLDEKDIAASGLLLNAIQFVNYRCMLAEEQPLIYLHLDQTYNF